MSRITITIDTTDTLDTKDFVFEVDDALNMGFKHPYEMWTDELKCGRWIADEHKPLKEMCSVCGFAQFQSRIKNFCPNCGARMEAD